MISLYLLLQGWLNIRKEGKKSLYDIMQGNPNLPGQAIIESLLNVSFSKYKYENRVITFIKSV